MPFSAYLSLFIVHLLCVALPGPSFFFITQTAFKYGKRNALMATLGSACGVTIWVTLTLMGLTVLLDRVPLLHQGLALAGSLYLLWVAQGMLRTGIRMWRQSDTARAVQVDAEPDMLSHDRFLKRPPALWRSLGKGLLVELSNPKSMIYFTSVLSFFLRPDMALRDTLCVGSMMVLIMLLWFVPISLLFSTRHARALYHRKAYLLDMVAGTLFVLLSVRILLSLV